MTPPADQTVVRRLMCYFGLSTKAEMNYLRALGDVRAQALRESNPCHDEVRLWLDTRATEVREHGL